MSLKDFHIFFIAVSSLTLLGFGVWCLYHRGADASVALPWLGGLSFLGGGGLIVYGKKFLDKMRREGIR